MHTSGFRIGLIIGVLGAAVIGLVIALVLTSGGDDETGADTETVVETTTPPPPTTTSTTTTTASEEVQAFRSPTGNIICRVTTATATCAAVEIDYSPPAQPTSCDLPGWGHVVGVDTSGAAAFICADDVPASYESPILAYGQGVLVGPFACGSSQDGVRCANRDTSHGFQLAREQARLF